MTTDEFDIGKIDKKLFFNKKKGGLELNDDGIKMIVKLTRWGLKVDDLAQFMGCAKSTFYTDINRDKFKEAYELGQSLQQLTFRQALVKRAEQGDAKCIIFGCKAICGMSDTVIPSQESSVLDGFVRAIEGLRSDYLQAHRDEDDEPKSYAEMFGNQTG